MNKLIFYFVFFSALLSAVPLAAHAAEADGLVVYSARIEELIKPLFDAFTKDTGISVKFITDKDGALLARLKAEGKYTPADMLVTSDAGNLWQAAQEKMLRPVVSETLQTNIPAHLRDPDNRWFGLSVRARTVVYNTNKIKPAELSSYEDLADQKWHGRLCLRSSKKVYNQSLVAMMIAEYGEAAAEKIVRGWVANLATDPFSDDTSVLESVAAGQCDVTIVNTYYYGRLMQKNPKLPLAIYWPNQKTNPKFVQTAGTTGVHINVSGAGITTHAKHEAAALKLLEFLSSDQAQQLFATLNMEYPANPKVKPDAAVAAWGDFEPNRTNLAKAGELQTAAVKLMDRAGYR